MIIIGVTGKSGAGKTTCLNILGGMDSATSGEFIIDGIDVTKLKDREKQVIYSRYIIGKTQTEQSEVCLGCRAWHR